MSNGSIAMNVREPFRAGTFYEASASSCRHQASALIESADLPDDLDPDARGGLVPHAGWTYSGRVAAKTFKALAAAGKKEGNSQQEATRGDAGNGWWLGALPVLVLVGMDLDPCRHTKADMNADGSTNGLDVQVCVGAMLGS